MQSMGLETYASISCARGMQLKARKNKFPVITSLLTPCIKSQPLTMVVHPLGITTNYGLHWCLCLHCGALIFWTVFDKLLPPHTPPPVSHPLSYVGSKLVRTQWRIQDRAFGEMPPSFSILQKLV